MKIILAGGSGLLGTTIRDKLLELRHSVVILTRQTPPSSSESDPQCRHIQWDGKSSGPWTNALEGSDAIINLAGHSIGSGRWTKTQKQKILGSRIDATRALVESVQRLENPPGILLNASGVNYYGHEGEEELKEDSPPGTDFLAETCMLWEEEADRGVRFGMRVVRMRTGFVLAHDAPAFRRMILPYRLFAGGHYGSGDQWFSWIHIDDIVSAYVYALESPLNGPVNAVAPSPLRVREFHRILGSVLRRPAWAHVPSFVLRAVLGEMADLILKGQRAVPAQLLTHGFSFRFPGAEEALTDILQ